MKVLKIFKLSYSQLKVSSLLLGVLITWGVNETLCHQKEEKLILVY